MGAVTPGTLQGSDGSPFDDEFWIAGLVDQDAYRLMSERMPTLDESQARLYFRFLESPVDNESGAAAARELDLSKSDTFEKGTRDGQKLAEEINILRFLKTVWDWPEVVDGIIAAFTWELSYPDLKEHTCTLEEMFEDLTTWFARDGKWRDKTYCVRK
ncbi:MAG: hypothetical protein JSV43_00705 [Methanobacteriota archaeon]|nr:MAG: hypothetical protein JSV43_00705 [Euryarchaeota archaeon]